ncbi:TPA: hypothetical protein ACH3X1_016822 [Trebouxia sp. C0004]
MAPSIFAFGRSTLNGSCLRMRLLSALIGQSVDRSGILYSQNGSTFKDGPFIMTMVSKSLSGDASVAPVPLHHYFDVANPDLHWVFDDTLLKGRSVLAESFMDCLPNIGNYAQANLSYYDEFDVVIQANNFWQPFAILHNPTISKVKLQSFEEPILAGCILNYLLAPAQYLQLRVHNLLIALKAEDRSLLAVQVRTGDSQEKDGHVLQVLFQHFQKCVVQLQAAKSTPFKIFVTTDSENVTNLFREVYPDSFTVAGQVSHIDGHFGVSGSPDVDFTKSVIDYLLIAFADDLIISRSGFAELAAVRGFKVYYSPSSCYAKHPVQYSFPDEKPLAMAISSVEDIILQTP